MESTRNLGMRIWATLLVLSMFLIPTAFSASWWDTNYDFREQINLTTGTNTPFRNYDGYTVQLTTDTTGSRFLTSGDDIRIVYWDGSTNTELDRELLNPNNANSRIRFQMQANQSASTSNITAYYIYYGNSAAGVPPENLSNVYLWYDDASVDRESDYTQGKVDTSAHGNSWGNTLAWNSNGYYTYDTGDNRVDSIRPTGVTERDIYIDYEAFQIDAFPNDMTTGPLVRWIGTGSGNSESSDHFYYYEMGESTILGGSYNSHDDITADNRESEIIENGLLPLFPANDWTRLGIAAFGVNPTTINAYYNNESGGWGGYRFTGTHAAGSDNEGAGQFGPWLQQEEGRLTNFTARRYIEPEPILDSFNQTQYYSNFTITLTDKSSSVTEFVEQRNTSSVTVNVSCSESFQNTCGEISVTLQRNTSSVNFVAVSGVSGATPVWTSTTQPQTCILDGGDSCSLTWTFNMTGPIGSETQIRTTGTSNNTGTPDFNSSIFDVDIVGEFLVTFNQSTYIFPNFDKNSGDRTIDLSVTSKGANNNINVQCLSGNCSLITSNWTNGVNLPAGGSQGVEFTCSDQRSGIISALYNISSDESSTTSDINLTCNLNPIFGPINGDLITPAPFVTTNVAQNATFDLEANLTCTGLCGNVTGYVVLERPKTGLTIDDPADSGWQIARDYPHFESGVYWIQTPAMADPDQIYVDMDYDGGGWMLVGRGREGWNWNDNGQGVASDIYTDTNSTSAFSPDYYNSTYIDELLNNEDLDTQVDGVRLRRALNTAGTLWQEVIWNFSTQNNWDWDFDSTIALSDYIVNGTNYGSDDTRDANPNNDNRRTYTFANSAHNNQEGFSYGAGECRGTNTPDNYLWEYAVECESIPFTQVYIRPRIADDTTGVVQTFSNNPIWSSTAQPQSRVLTEDESFVFTWTLNATGAINSTNNLSVLFFSNISGISRNRTSIATVLISDNIVPTINLLYPENNSKIIGDTPINFTWTVSDDETPNTCELFVDDISLSTQSCATSGVNISSLQNINYGEHTWFVQTNDSSGNFVNSSTFTFTLIRDYDFRFSKRISYENTDQYLINLSAQNLNSNYLNYTIIDYIDSNFTAGSFFPLFNFTNVTSFNPFVGNIYGWNLNLNQNLSYSVTGLNSRYNLIDLMIFGSE